MPLPRTAVQGKLTGDPELHWDSAGEAYVMFVISAAQFERDEGAGKWVATESIELPVLAKRRIAENVAESLRKNDEALVMGKLRRRPDGTVGLEADSVGVGLTFRKTVHSADARKAEPKEPELAHDPWAS